MTPKRLVLYHRDCDGYGSAFACHCAFRQPAGTQFPDTPFLGTDDTTYVGVQYNEPLPSQAYAPWDEIYIVDFSYPLETLLALAQDCPKVVVIDHHKTAEETLRRFSEEVPRPHDVCFNLGKSGAELTWEYFYAFDQELGGNPTPDILRYVGDRDLWKWELPNSREVNLYIASLPWDFAVWDRFDLNTAVAAGSAIAAYEDQIIKASVKRAYMGELDGHRVPFVNCTAVISETGDKLCKEFPDAPFVVLYQIKDDKIIYSLRSCGGFDVSEVAKKFSGGGHPAAAGFAQTIEQNYGGLVPHSFGFKLEQHGA